jgi:hypothetical protein
LRSPDYLGPQHREQFSHKWLYKLIAGSADGIAGPFTRTVALTILREDASLTTLLRAFSDIIEGLFAIMLRTLQSINPDSRYELHLYAKMVPSAFRPRVTSIGGNAMSPTQAFIRIRVSFHEISKAVVSIKLHLKASYQQIPRSERQVRLW